MVGTIGPLVRGRPFQWALSIALFTLASGLSSGSAGWILGVVGRVLVTEQWEAALTIAVGALLLVAIDAGTTGHTFSMGRSVPQDWWRSMSAARASIAYGLVLGLGFTTIVPFATFYLLPIAAIALGPSAGAIIGLSYGLGRAAPIWVASALMKTGSTPDSVGAWALGPQQRIARVLVALVALGIAVGHLVQVRPQT